MYYRGIEGIDATVSRRKVKLVVVSLERVKVLEFVRLRKKTGVEGVKRD